FLEVMGDLFKAFTLDTQNIRIVIISCSDDDILCFISIPISYHVEKAIFLFNRLNSFKSVDPQVFSSDYFPVISESFISLGLPVNRQEWHIAYFQLFT